MDYGGELNWVLEKWIFDVSTPPTLLIFSYFTCLRTDPQNDQNFWWERESLISRSSLKIGRWGPSIKKKLQYHDSINMKVSTMEFKISSFDKFGQKIKSVPNLLVMQFLLLIKCRQILLNLQQFAVFAEKEEENSAIWIIYEYYFPPSFKVIRFNFFCGNSTLPDDLLFASQIISTKDDGNCRAASSRKEATRCIRSPIIWIVYEEVCSHCKPRMGELIGVIIKLIPAVLLITSFRGKYII